MKITTETGSVYEIDDRLICRKYDKNGVGIDSFKVWYMKSVPDDVLTMSELYDLPKGDPEVGKRLYLGGRDSWWLSTRVVKIEE
jgi:hypothetical protein